jgi:carbamoyltransferase
LLWLRPGAGFAAEGIGDYSNGTVSIFSEEGRRELAATRDNHIGHIYQYITLLLGMKPAQHEYKVMGLAPMPAKNWKRASGVCPGAQSGRFEDCL